MTVSLLRSLKASANAWRIPKSPTTLGPRLRWMPAKTFRSKTVKKATAKISGKSKGKPFNQSTLLCKSKVTKKKNANLKKTNTFLKATIIDFKKGRALLVSFKKRFLIRTSSRGEIRGHTF